MPIYVNIILYNFRFPFPTVQLATRAWQRLKTSYRPATQKNYSRMFKEFLVFLVAAGLSLTQVNTAIILAFLEYLVENGLNSDNIANYLAVIRAMFITYSLSTKPLRDEKIQLFIKALKINKPFAPVIPTIITEDMLRKICAECEYLQNPVVFKALYSFAFFSFLRMSNLLPHCSVAFDITRQLCRGDVFFSDLVQLSS